LGKSLNLILVEKSRACFVNDIFHSSELRYHDFCISLRLSSFKDSLVKVFAHSKERFLLSSCFFSRFAKSRKSRCSRVTDIIVSIVLEESQ
jgi:hypothetical protein